MLIPSSSAPVPFPAQPAPTRTLPATDRKQARRFLHLLDPTASNFTFQAFDDDNNNTRPGLARATSDRDEIVRLYEFGAGVYVTINETDLTGRKSENIKRIRAVWQEDDKGHGGPFPLDPSIVVESSPKHFHRYWLVANNWPADEYGRADFAKVMARMVASYGCDNNAKDISRVLRLPGFLHRKDPTQPHMVHLVADNGRRYTREQITQAFPPVEREPRREREWRSNDSDEERIADALRVIPADDRGVWLQIGMALKDGLGDHGRPLWDNWAASCPEKFKDRDQDRTWRSFRRNGIGIGTLFYHAQRHGWSPPRETSKEKTKKTDAPTNQQQSDNVELVMRAASTIKMEPVSWLWEGRMAIGKLCLVAGEPGLAKSQVTLWLAAAVTKGGRLPAGEKAPFGRVIILSAEDTAEDTIVPRLKAVDADLERISIISMVRETKAGISTQRSFDLQLDLPALEHAIQELKDVTLIIIDPIASYMGKRVDSHKNAEVRAVLEPVPTFAAKYKVTILGITHFSKGAGPTAINKFIGSIAFIAAARSAYVVTMDPDSKDEDRRLFLPVKNNLARLGQGLAFRVEQVMVEADGIATPVSHVRWLEEETVERSANAVLAELAEARDSAVGQAEDFLREFLAGGRCRMTDVQQAAKGHGHAWRTVERAKRSLGVVSINDPETPADKDTPPKACWFWELPSEEPR
jgi:putative DNA primase/helicase